MSAAATTYYVVSEAVTNVEKHARATVIDIDLHLEDSTLVLDVTDDGVGNAVTTSGGGLAGLRDRLEAYGGSILVRSASCEGTCLHVVLPLDGALEEVTGS